MYPIIIDAYGDFMLIHAMPHPVIDCCCPFSYLSDNNAKATVTAMLK